MKELLSALTPFLIALILWSAVWKAIALWRAGRNNQLTWFIILFIVNTAGILEVLYLVFFQKRHL